VIEHGVVQSKERDHELWAHAELERMWHLINISLHEFRLEKRFTLHLQTALQKLEEIILYFCDPAYAWATHPHDEEEEEKPLSPKQEAFRLQVAQQAWEALSLVPILNEMSLAIFGHDITEWTGGNFIQNLQQELHEKLLQLHLDMPSHLRMPPLVRAYLQKPFTENEPFFSDEYDFFMQAK
jgi:hypothetical protein